MTHEEVKVSLAISMKSSFPLLFSE